MTDSIDVFEQNSIRVRTRTGNIYVDPFGVPEEFHDAALILITHDHYDHFSTEDIAKVAGKNSIMVVPEKMAGKAKEVGDVVKTIKTVKPGTYQQAAGFEFETIPAYNIMKPFHPKGAEWVGYILRIEDKRIYIAGDTDATKEAKAVRCDIALVPIGGTFTMDAKKAADLVNEIRPSVTIPVHYGTVVGKPQDEKVFAEYVKDPIKVEFKIPF